MNSILYIANARIPSERAHSIQILKMCEAFAENGIKTTLIIPKRKKEINSKINEYYQIEKIFKIKKIFCIDYIFLDKYTSHFSNLRFLIQELSFVISTFFIQKPHNQIIYTRVKLAAFIYLLIRRKVIYEAHVPANGNFLEKYIAKHSHKIICITKSIQKSWKDFRANTIYLPDGVSQEFFNNISQKIARQKLNIKTKKKIIVYTGNLYKWKGTDTLIESAKKLKNINFFIVGNTKKINSNISKADNIKIVGHRPYSEIPLWLKAADILIIPNSAKYRKGSHNTSPLKLFEYMASGTSIIASKVPAIEEIVNSNEVTFFEPDNIDDLITKIISFKKIDTKKQISKAREYTWKKRAERIINAI